jgi:hypothetical protein
MLNSAAGDVYLFGGNGQLQLGRPGAERKLVPTPFVLAKNKRIIYLHCEPTSTFALSGNPYFPSYLFFLPISLSSKATSSHATFPLTFFFLKHFAADKRMYFWGSTPMNPNQHVRASEPIKDLPSVGAGYTLVQLEEMKRLREIEVKR